MKHCCLQDVIDAVDHVEAVERPALSPERKEPAMLVQHHVPLDLYVVDRLSEEAERREMQPYELSAQLIEAGLIMMAHNETGSRRFGVERDRSGNGLHPHALSFDGFPLVAIDDRHANEIERLNLTDITDRLSHDPEAIVRATVAAIGMLVAEHHGATVASIVADTPINFEAFVDAVRIAAKEAAMPTEPRDLEDVELYDVAPILHPPAGSHTSIEDLGPYADDEPAEHLGGKDDDTGLETK